MPDDVATLSPAERQVLAALSVVGHASLSSAQLAQLVELDDVRPVIADLAEQGFMQKNDDERYALAGRIGERIRDTDDALASGDRLIQHFTTLATGGALTPERLAEEAQAILGLSEWAAEHRQWARLLEFVKTLQSCFGIANRIQQWLALLQRGREASQAIGDRQSEIWVLEQMATASQSAGDAASAQRYLDEAARLRTGGAAEAVAAGGSRRLARWIIGIALATAVGIGAGMAIGSGKSDRSATTTNVPVTVTANGQTVTTSKTISVPATTVTSTFTETTTETTTVTTTVTTSPPTPAPR